MRAHGPNLMAVLLVAGVAATQPGPTLGDDLSNHPDSGYNFSLLIDGVEAGRFVEASELGANVDVIEYREGGSDAQVRELPGQAHFQPIVLRYGISESMELWNWFETSLLGEPEPRTVALVMYENDGRTEAYRWILLDAWVSSLHASRATDMINGSITVESVTIVYDGLERD